MMIVWLRDEVLVEKFGSSFRKDLRILVDFVDEENPENQDLRELPWMRLRKFNNIFLKFEFLRFW